MKDPDPGCECFTFAQPGGTSVSELSALTVVEKWPSEIELGQS